MDWAVDWASHSRATLDWFLLQQVWELSEGSQGMEDLGAKVIPNLYLWLKCLFYISLAGEPGSLASSQKPWWKGWLRQAFLKVYGGKCQTYVWSIWYISSGYHIPYKYHAIIFLSSHLNLSKEESPFALPTLSLLVYSTTRWNGLLKLLSLGPSVTIPFSGLTGVVQPLSSWTALPLGLPSTLSLKLCSLGSSDASLLSNIPALSRLQTLFPVCSSVLTLHPLPGWTHCFLVSTKSQTVSPSHFYPKLQTHLPSYWQHVPLVPTSNLSRPKHLPP